MTHEIAKNFWFQYLKLAHKEDTDFTTINPINDFWRQYHLGVFDETPDDEWDQKVKDTKELSRFWNDNFTETARNIFLTAVYKTNITDEDIDKIADILADASTRSDYGVPEPTDANGRESGMESMIPDEWNTMNTDYKGMPPRAIYSRLDSYIYGQEKAKRAVSMLVYNHLRGNSRNIVIAGPTGCGKTEIWRVLAQEMNCIRIVNGPQLTCDGWKGTYKISDIFSNEPKEIAEHMILVIDEADKLFEPQITSGGTDHAKMIQNELLRLMDGDTLIFVNEKDRSNQITVDCSGVSIVLCGSFEYMLQAKSEDSGSIGFGQTGKRSSQIMECTEEDLVQYANIRREIAGRINQIVTLDALNAADFENIMEYTQSPIRKIEMSHQVSLSIDEKTKKKLACDAEKSKMGCRYIRSKLQSMLDEQMFDDPDKQTYELHCA